MKKGEVQLLLILGGNPVYDAPSDLAFGESLLKAGLRIHLTGYPDETSRYCQWAVPMAHYLEAWSDVRSLDGTAAIVQPLVEPLYEGKSPHELLSVLLDETPRKGYDVVKESWKAARPAEADFEAFWRKALHDGVVAGTAFAPKALPVRVAEVAQALAAATLGRRQAVRPRGRLPARPVPPRRPLRQQRLAPGAPEAAQQADVGQRGDRLPRHRAEARPPERGRREGHGEREERRAPRPHPAGPGGGRRHAPPRLRPRPRRARRQRRRRRRHAAPDDRRALDRRRHSSRRRARAPRSRTRSSTSGWRGARSSG